MDHIICPYAAFRPTGFAHCYYDLAQRAWQTAAAGLSHAFFHIVVIVGPGSPYRKQRQKNRIPF